MSQPTHIDISNGRGSHAPHFIRYSLVLALFALCVLGAVCISDDGSDAAVGDQFTVDHLVYKIISEDDKEVSVTGHDPVLDSNSLAIPNTVDRGGSYSVVSIDDRVFNGFTGITSVSIGNNVRSIGYQAFLGCTSLRSVTLGTSVNDIESETFMNCFRLVEICNNSSLPLTAGSTEYGNIAYHAVNIYGGGGGTSVLRTVDLDGAGTAVYYVKVDVSLIAVDNPGKNIVLPDKLSENVYSIRKYAFYQDAVIEGIIFGSGVKSIGEKSFVSCESLTSVSMNESISSIGNQAFSGCISLKNVKVPNSVTNLGSYAFSGCTSLESVILGSGITALPNFVFNGCPSLNSFKCSDSLFYYGSGAFQDCVSLTSFTIGAGTTTIVGDAFKGCSGLTGSADDVRMNILATTAPTIGDNAFPAGTYLGVPDASLSAYKTAWPAYASTIVSDKYEIKFMNGSEVFYSYKAYKEETVVLPSTQPVKESTDKYDYKFKSWDGYTEGMTVTGNMTFTAVYEEIQKNAAASGNGFPVWIIIVIVAAVIIIAGVVVFFIRRNGGQS